MTQRELPPDFLKLIESIQQRRPRTVLDHILEHGHITTEELKNRYGYNHPPRAARDVREHGIPRYNRKLWIGGVRQVAYPSR